MNIRHYRPRWTAALLLMLPLLAAGCLAPSLGFNAPEFKEVLLQGEGSDKMLLIDINGPISNRPLLIPGVGILPGMTARIRQELELAFDDRSIRGILLRINSPGGTLTDSDVIYHSLVEFKRSKKVKIIASLGDVAASGGLYVAMAADEIFAHPTTLTGSIGVILPHMDYSGLLKKLGIRSNPITSGKYKDIDSPFRPRSPAEEKMLQQIIDHQYKQFIKVILEGRKKLTSEKLKEFADGRLLTAEQALEVGLVDSIGYLDDAYSRLSEVSGFTKNRLVRYSNSWLTGNNIYTNTFPIELLGN